MNIELIQNIQEYYPILWLMIVGLIWGGIKNVYICIRYIIFIILSLVITGICTQKIHEHFFEWGQGYFEYRSNVFFDSTLLNSYINSSSNEEYSTLLHDSLNFIDVHHKILNTYGKVEDTTSNGKVYLGIKNSYYHNVLISKDHKNVFSYKQDIPTQIATTPFTITMEKNGYLLSHTINKVQRTTLETFISYLQAIGKGQVLYAKPYLKYTDIFYLNLAILFVIIVLFMSRRYHRSLKQIRMIRETLYKED
jgi:hypothetical protein